MAYNRIRAAAALFVLASGFAWQASAPAMALSMKECSTKYNAAKTSNTLGGQSWNDFRKAQCSDTAAPAAATAPAPTAAAPAKPVATAPAVPAKPTMVPPAPAANVVFPSKVDPKYSTLSAGKQRFKTCDDQYNVNKASGGNGSLKWIQKGGGYYSQCNARLKGA